MIGLLAMAWAATPSESNISATSVGVQHWQTGALAEDAQDTDFLLGQRLRWTLIANESLQLRARVNGRFTLSPGDEAFFKRNRVRQLGVSLLTDSFTLDIGRHAVHKGGPRLVDGVQFIAHPSRVFDIGAWGGMSPDLFTTEFRTRFGGGPIIAYSASRIQTSLVGEVLVGGGGLDRVAALAMARLSAARTIEISGRLDVDILSADDKPHLADAQVFARWAPIDAMRFDVFYDAFSSYRYRNTENLDPDVQRFALRYLNNGDPRFDAVLQNCFEPKVAQAVGTSFRLRPRGEGVAPHVALNGRYRFGGDEDILQNADPNDPDVAAVQAICGFDDINEFIRVNPQVGIVRLPVLGALDVMLDVNLYSIEGKSQYDGGVILYWEPTDDGTFAFDTSYRLLLNPFDANDNPYGYVKSGHYFDVFIDLVVVPVDMTIGTGINVVSEPSPLVDELGVGAFARVTKYLRKRKKKADND